MTPVTTPNMAKKRADMLNGRQYRSELSKEEEAQAKLDGVIIIFWASDDLAEVHWYFRDEVWCRDWGMVYIDEEDVQFPDNEECNRCKDNMERSCKQVSVIRDTVIDKWDVEKKEVPVSWRYETDIPHEKFLIMEDEDVYCEGIVFEYKHLKKS